MVDEVEKSLHLIIEELKRWQTIIGGHYIDHKLEKERNRLASIPYGYHTTTYVAIDVVSSNE